MSHDGLWSRREFLTLAVTATGSLVLVSCSPTGETTTTTLTPTSLAAGATSTTTTTAPPIAGSYWDLLREARRRVRTSPDHLPAHVSRLAESGDIEGLVTLLRDHVAVVPANPQAWVSNTDGQRWGARGVLRARVGTPREIAQLLADTLNDAGVDAELVGVPGQGTMRPVLVNPQPLAFSPLESADDLFELSGADPTPDLLPADPVLAAAIADAALAAIDPGHFDSPSTSALTAGMPGVQIGEQIAGLWTSEPGPTAADNGLRALGDIAAAPEARFTLSIATNLDPTNPIEVADAAFRLDQLAGRRVDVAFVPPASSLADLIATRPADVTTVIPTIQVAGLDVTDDERADLVSVGTPFTIEGETLLEEGDRLVLSGGSIGGDGDPSRAAEIRINRVVATHYPRVGVEVDVLDDSGATVRDLGALNFTLDDDGTEVPFTLRRSDRPAPRIVFVVDNSSSVPEEFRNAGATRVVTEIATAVKQQHPAAQFRAAIVSISGAGLLGWRDDPVRVGEDVDQFGIGSGLWNSYVDAAVPEANVIVFLTDGVASTDQGDPQDEPPPELIAGLTSGPPAIMLGSGELGAAFRGIADITGGVALPIDDQDSAIAAVLEQLDKSLMPYDFLVLADEDATATDRTIGVRLATSGVAATAPFTVPVAEETSVGRSVVGIYLRVQANGITVDRTLAGLPYRTTGDITPRLVQEVRQALFGSYSVITEAGAPSPSQLLDDALAELLTWEPVFAATTAEEAMAALQAAEELPHGAFAFSVPVTAEGPLTWDTGLRMWLSTERTAPRDDGDVIRRSVDLLPVSRFLTATDDPIESIELTARRTAWLAAYEAAMYEDTAAARLTGTLADTDVTNVADQDREALRLLTNGWPGRSRFLVNNDVDAAVAFDRANGTLIAVLPDGTGGGVTEESIKTDFKQAIALTELASKHGAFKAWAEFEKAKLEKLRFATLVIYRMSVEGILETIKEEACKKVKKKATAWALGALGYVDPFGSESLKLFLEHAKEVKRFGDAAGLAPAIPTDLPVC